MQSLPERIQRKISPCPNTGCWFWTGATDSAGYGQVWFSSEKRVISSHRAVYRLSVREIPEGLELDHKCRQVICCNPDHLEPVTPKENIRRGTIAAVQSLRAASQTRCVNGHERNNKNTREGRQLGKNGNFVTRRVCRVCQKLRMRLHYAKKRKEVR